MADLPGGTVDAAVQAEIEHLEGQQPPDNGPDQGEPEPGAEEGQDDALDEQAQDDQEEQPESEGDAEFVDYDKDGTRYRVPKALKDDLMLKADYTRKRMEEARYVEGVKQREAQLPTLFDTGTQFQQERAQLSVLDAHIGELMQTNWAQLQATDALEFSTRSGQLALMRQQREMLVSDLQQKYGAFQQHQEKQRVEQANNTAATLIRDHGWTRDRHVTVQNVAQKYLGHNPVVMQALHDGVDPAVYLLLEKAAKWDQLQAKKPQPLPKSGVRPTQQQQAPRQVVVRAGPGSQPSQRAGSTVSQAMGRLKTTGSVQDAVAVELARMGGARRR